jgi:putative endopeptidase
MLWKKALAVISLGIFSLVIRTAPASAQKPAHAAPKAKAAKPAPASKPVLCPKAFDLSAMDRTVDPCDDFFEYSCGRWRKDNPIPPDQARWGRFNELAEYNRQILHEILEKASAKSAKRGLITRKIGDFYQACMNEEAANTKSAAPLKPILARIAAISSRDQLVDAIAYLHSQGVGVLFGFSSQPDLHDASLEVANIGQGGLGLPDRDYYLNQDAHSQDTRQKYVQHLTNMFVLLGDDASAAAKEAQSVMQIETKLADASFERTKMRDPKNRDHKMKVSDLAALAPNFEFERYFQATTAPSFAEVNVVPPDFFQKVNAAIDSFSLDDWKSYLRSHSARAAAPHLSDAFVQENFSFYGRFLSGQQELQARWKRCVQLTDNLLGEALGQPYVAKTFGANGKQHVLKMVDELEKALAQDIQDLSWMTPDTKKQAEVKLQAITNKIGYPDKWRDYSTLKIEPNDLLGNVLRARHFESQFNLHKIGKPLDKREWGMSPPTVNAYYNAAENDINFPAGILQPPFFDKTQDDAVNFGGIGVVIGHELTHGFDDQGSKFDADGNLRNWWTDSDRAEFEKRTDCIADEYSSFVPLEDIHLNGRLTLGENAADNGGVQISFMALTDALAHAAKDSPAKQTREGFTPAQRFFISFAQIWCENRTPESSRLAVKTDPHSPGRFRTNGALQNNSDFAKAFGCGVGRKMVSAKACRAW